jgi:hypothetical protein
LIECNSSESLISCEGGSKNAPKKVEENSPLKCLCPSHKVPADFPEAVSIRRFQILLMFLEIVYIVLDVVVYGSWYMALFEVPRLWMCYYNFMTLSLCMMNVFMIYIVVGAVGSTLSIFTIGLTGGVLGIFNYVIFPA